MVAVVEWEGREEAVATEVLIVVVVVVAVAVVAVTGPK